MNILIIGYGRMGKLVEKVSGSMGADISEIIDPKEAEISPGKVKDWSNASLTGADIAICFTDPEPKEIGYETTKRILEAGISAAVGTTQFYVKPDGTLNEEMLHELERIAKSKKVRFLYAPNFSVGVNKFVAELRRDAPFYSENGYRPVVIEAHHTGKTKDVSGTAKSLIGPALLEAYPDKDGLWFSIDQSIWPERYNEKFESSLLDAPFDPSVTGMSANMIRAQIKEAEGMNKIPIIALRYGDIPGRHRVNFIGETDTIARESAVTDREIFAKDALKVAQELLGKKPGLYCITDMI